MVDFTGGRGSSGAAPSQFSRNTGPRFGGAPATGSFGAMLGARPAAPPPSGGVPASNHVGMYGTMMPRPTAPQVQPDMANVGMQPAQVAGPGSTPQQRYEQLQSLRGQFNPTPAQAPSYGGAAGIPGADRSGQNYGYDALAGGVGPAATTRWQSNGLKGAGRVAGYQPVGQPAAPAAPAAPAPQMSDPLPMAPDASIMPVPEMSAPLQMAPMAPPMPDDPINKYAPVARGPGYTTGAPMRMGYFGGMV